MNIGCSPIFLWATMWFNELEHKSLDNISQERIIVINRIFHINTFIQVSSIVKVLINWSHYPSPHPREIIGKYGSQVRTSIGRPPSESPFRLTARHFPSRIESTETQLNPRRKCYVCANTVRRARSRRDTSYECIECDVGLCLMDCFKDYHTLQAF